MPGRTYCCNSPGYGTHLNSVVRSLKTAAGPSLDWAVKLLFFLAVLALYVWQMSSWDEIERQKCICTEVCVIEGIRITIANMDDSISVSICWYCFNILCMPQRVYCTPLIQITKQKAYMKACSWLSAPVDKDVELVYIMIGDSTRHVSTWRCVEKITSERREWFEDMSTRMRFDSRAWGWASVNGGWCHDFPESSLSDQIALYECIRQFGYYI